MHASRPHQVSLQHQRACVNSRLTPALWRDGKTCRDDAFPLTSCPSLTFLDCKAMQVKGCQPVMNVSPWITCLLACFPTLGATSTANLCCPMRATSDVSCEPDVMYIFAAQCKLAQRLSQTAQAMPSSAAAPGRVTSCCSTHLCQASSDLETRSVTQASFQTRLYSLVMQTAPRVAERSAKLASTSARQGSGARSQQPIGTRPPSILTHPRSRRTSLAQPVLGMRAVLQRVKSASVTVRLRHSPVHRALGNTWTLTMGHANHTTFHQSVTNSLITCHPTMVTFPPLC